MSKIEKKVMTFVLEYDKGNELISNLILSIHGEYKGVHATCVAHGDEMARLEELEEKYNE